MSPNSSKSHSAVPSYIEDDLSTVLSTAYSDATITREQEHFTNVADTTEIVLSQLDPQERDRRVTNANGAFSGADEDQSAPQQINQAVFSFQGITEVELDPQSEAWKFLTNPKFMSSDDGTTTTVQKNLISFFQTCILFQDCLDMAARKSHKLKKRKVVHAILRTMGTLPADFKGLNAIYFLLRTYGAARQAEIRRLRKLGETPVAPANPRTALLTRLIDRYLVFKDTRTPIPQPSNSEDLDDRVSERVQTLQVSLNAILRSADAQHGNQDDQVRASSVPQDMFTTFAAMIPSVRVELKWFQPWVEQQQFKASNSHTGTQKQLGGPPIWAISNVQYDAEFKKIFGAAESVYTPEQVLNLFQLTSKSFQAALYKSLRIEKFTSADPRFVSILEQQHVVQNCEPCLSERLRVTAWAVHPYFFPCLALAHSANSTSGKPVSTLSDEQMDDQQPQSQSLAPLPSGRDEANKESPNENPGAEKVERLGVTDSLSALRSLETSQGSNSSVADQTSVDLAHSESVERERKILKDESDEQEQKKILKTEDQDQFSTKSGRSRYVKRKRDLFDDDDVDKEREGKTRKTEADNNVGIDAWTYQMEAARSQKKKEMKKQRGKKAKSARKRDARRQQARAEWEQALKQALEKSTPLTSQLSLGLAREWEVVQKKWEQMGEQGKMEWFEAKTEPLQEAFYRADVDEAQHRLVEAKKKKPEYYQSEIDEAQRRLEEIESQRFHSLSEVDEARRLLDQAKAPMAPFQAAVDEAQRCLDEAKSRQVQRKRQRYYWERRLEIQKYQAEWWSFRKEYEMLCEQCKMEWDQKFVKKCQKPWKDSQDEELQKDWEQASNKHARAEAVRAEMEQALRPGQARGTLLVKTSVQTYKVTRDYSSFWALYLA